MGDGNSCFNIIAANGTSVCPSSCCILSLYCALYCVYWRILFVSFSCFFFSFCVAASALSSVEHNPSFGCVADSSAPHYRRASGCRICIDFSSRFVNGVAIFESSPYIFVREMFSNWKILFDTFLQSMAQKFKFNICVYAEYGRKTLFTLLSLEYIQHTERLAGTTIEIRILKIGIDCFLLSICKFAC